MELGRSGPAAKRRQSGDRICEWTRSEIVFGRDVSLSRKRFDRAVAGVDFADRFQLRLQDGFSFGGRKRRAIHASGRAGQIHGCDRSNEACRKTLRARRTQARGQRISRRTAISTSCWVRKTARRKCCETTATTRSRRSSRSPGFRDCARLRGRILMVTGMRMRRLLTAQNSCIFFITSGKDNFAK